MKNKEEDMNTQQENMVDFKQHYDASEQFGKEIIYYIMVILCLIIVLSLGMLLVNWSMTTRL